MSNVAQGYGFKYPLEVSPVHRLTFFYCLNDPVVELPVVLF